MAAYSGGELGEAAHSVPRELLRHAQRAAWLSELRRAGLPVDDDPTVATALRVDSVDRGTGDPQLLSVRERDGERPWRIDRRTLRVNQAPDAPQLTPELASMVADLADRAQLQLGRPVTLSWCARGDGAVLVDVVPLSPRVRFSNAGYRRIAPLRAEPGTLSPFAVDILDLALRTQGNAGGEGVVRRIYARAYRRQVSTRLPGLELGRGRLRRAASLAQQAARDLATLGTEALRSRGEFARAFERMDAVALGSLDNEDLLESLDARVGLVVRALRLLERSRQTTLSLLPILTRVTGPVPRDLLAALAELSPTPERAAINDRLIALGHLLLRERGQIEVPTPADSVALREAFARASDTLRGERPLGMDVRPAPFDESPEALLAGVHEARSMLEIAPQQRRREAERVLLERARTQGRLRGGSPAARVGLMLLRRIAHAKGVIADGLAHALLRARASVIEAGTRLADEGVLDQPDDAFYLEVDELAQALRGELGAYAARSRFRREDDQRWRNYRAPHRIPPRLPGRQTG